MTKFAGNLRYVLSSLQRLWWALLLDVVLVGGFAGSTAGWGVGLAAAVVAAVFVVVVTAVVLTIR